MGFPWALAGATQVGNPLLRPLAALGGIHALTLALLLGSLLLLRLAQSRGRHRWAWGGLALWLALTPLLGRLARGDARDQRRPSWRCCSCRATSTRRRSGTAPGWTR
jgi:apolipoprotein N-acyltransferase